MRITFCNLCDESIPYSDFQLGRAVRRAGRAVCARCEESMGGDVPGASAALQNAPSAGSTNGAGSGVERHARSREHAAQSPPARAGAAAATAGPRAFASHTAAGGGGGGAGLAIALAVVAILFSSGAAVFLLERIERDARSLTEMRSELSDELDRSAERIEERFDARVAGAFAEAREAKRATGELEQTLQASLREAPPVAGTLAEVQSAIERLAARIEAAEGRSPSAGADPRELERLQAGLAELHAEVLRLAHRMGQIEGTPDRLVLPGSEPVNRPSWWPQVAKLASQNSGTRWSAVQALGETRDPEVAEHLTPMLKDPDIFVRMATARVLGDLRAVIALPALLDALEDAEPSVREAAVVSLRTISGQSFRFDPTADPAERAKRLEAWRDWWSRAASDLLGGR